MVRALITASGLLFSGLTLSAGSATYQIGGQGNQTSLDYAWRDGAVRMETGQPNGYMLLRDSETYMVSQAGGQTRVMAMSGMMNRFQGATARPMANAKVESFSLDATGRSETVAGLTGEVYTTSVVHADGSRSNGEMVLSDDPLVAELTRAQSSIGASFMSDDNPMAQQFLDRGQGMLRFTDERGNSMRLTRISRDAPPASAFELPAEPMQMPGSGAAPAQPNAGTQSDEGGLFGGAGDAAAKKAQRQKERQTSKVEKRVDREADNTVDKAVDGAMDAIFGN